MKPGASAVDTNGLMQPPKTMMADTRGLQSQHRAVNTEWPRNRMVTQTDSECWQIAGSTHIAAWTDFHHRTALLPPQQREEQLLFPGLCDEGQVEQLEHAPRSESSSEESTPAIVSLRNAFSFSMIER